MLLNRLCRNRTATVGESHHVGSLMTVQRYRDSMDSLDRLPDDVMFPVNVCLVKDFELRYFLPNKYRRDFITVAVTTLTTRGAKCQCLPL